MVVRINVTARRAARGSWTVGAVLSAILAACSNAGSDTGSMNPGAQDTMLVVTGANQTVLANTDAPVNPTVRITNASGQPVPGVTVIFRNQTVGASVGDSLVQTDSSGTASAEHWNSFYAGTAELQATAANVLGSPVTFTATIWGHMLAQPANGTNMQQAPAGTAIAMPPQVSLFSPNNESLSGLRVVFHVIAGGGTITGDTAVVNAVGVATVGSWTLGPTPGVNQLRAVVLQPLGGDSTTITATGTE